MSNNSNLRKAAKAKNDEFYTRIEDIQEELYHYQDQFENKTVYLNCDNPEESKFWLFFKLQFDILNIKRLICTHYDTTNSTWMQELIRNENGTIEERRTELNGNGDFRSPECIALLDECDIVVTNPPFSLFKEFVPLMIEHGKKFLVIGNMQAITYKAIFPFIKNGQLWAGYQFNKTMEFIMPDSYELKGKAYIDEDGKKHGFVMATCWFTNLEVAHRHDPLQLRCHYSPEKYPEYDNYDAIHVKFTKDIPGDYYGKMGVPISFLKDYCPDQFEILGGFNGYNPKTADPSFMIYGDAVKIPTSKSLFRGPVVNGKAEYFRIIIKRKINN